LTTNKRKGEWRIQDAAQLRPALTTLFAAYRCTLDDEALRAYWAGLRTVELEWVREACAIAVRSLQRLPSAAQLHQIAGECAERAEWDQRVASTSTPEPEPPDPAAGDLTALRLQLLELYRARGASDSAAYPEILSAVRAALTAGDPPRGAGRRGGLQRAGTLLADFATMGSRAIVGQWLRSMIAESEVEI
jgi:hypothetical protein